MTKITVADEAAFADESQMALRAIRAVVERLMKEEGISLPALVAATSMAYTGTLATLLACAESAGLSEMIDQLREESTSLLALQLDAHIVEARARLNAEAFA